MEKARRIDQGIIDQRQRIDLGRKKDCFEEEETVVVVVANRVIVMKS